MSAKLDLELVGDIVNWRRNRCRDVDQSRRWRSIVKLWLLAEICDSLAFIFGGVSLYLSWD